MTGTIEAVTFDYWGTLIYEPRPRYLRDRRIDAWQTILRRAGHRVDPSILTEAFDASWVTYESAWAANSQYRSEDAAKDVFDSLGLARSDGLMEDLVTAFAAVWEGADLPLADGAEDAIRALRERGVRLGIVCDVGMTPSVGLRSILDRHGLRGSFEHLSFSDEVGVYKPAREIFEDALGGMGQPTPGRTAHVGDRRRTDVAGAHEMGMIAVRYRGLYDDPGPGPEAGIVIDRHGDLVSSLGWPDWLVSCR